MPSRNSSRTAASGPETRADRRAYFLLRTRLPATKAWHSEFPCVNIFSKIGEISDCPMSRCLMTAQFISLKTGDGHSLAAYEAHPGKPPRGGIVLLQEIFGITSYIRRVCEGYSQHGYHVVAPALFDRVRPQIEFTFQGRRGDRPGSAQQDSMGKYLRRSRSSQGAAGGRGQDRDAWLLLGWDGPAGRGTHRRNCRGICYYGTQIAAYAPSARCWRICRTTDACA